MAEHEGDKITRPARAGISLQRQGVERQATVVFWMTLGVGALILLAYVIYLVVL